MKFDSKINALGEEKQQDLSPQQLQQKAVDRFQSDNVLNQFAIEINENVPALLSAKYSVREVQGIPSMNLHAVLIAWDSMFCSSPVQFYLLNRLGELVDTTEKELREWQINHSFGDLVNELYLFDRLPADADRAAVCKDARTLITNTLLKFVKTYRQRKLLHAEVDIFATSSRIEMGAEKARVYLQHEPFKEDHGVPGAVIEAVWPDWLNHFPQFEDLLAMIAAARFAPDRRSAFIWWQGSSGFGKGMLISALKDLGAVEEMSVKEIERAFEGQPSGASANSIMRAWVLVVDEWKSAKSELKQLNNSIILSSKGQLKSEAPVYTKLFTSAEGVSSLAGSEGVEEQFARRFQYIKSTGHLDDREMLNQVGRGEYRRALSTVLARHLNQHVEQMRQVGRIEAERQSEAVLKELAERYSLLHHFTSLEQSVEDHARDLCDLITDYGQWITGAQFGQSPGSFDALDIRLQKLLKQSVKAGFIGAKSERCRAYALTRPVTFIKEWLNSRVEYSQRALISHKATRIAELADYESSPTKGRRFYITPQDNHGDWLKSVTLKVSCDLGDQVTNARSAESVSFF